MEVHGVRAQARWATWTQEWSRNHASTLQKNVNTYGTNFDINTSETGAGVAATGASNA